MPGARWTLLPEAGGVPQREVVGGVWDIRCRLRVVSASHASHAQRGSRWSRGLTRGVRSRKACLKLRREIRAGRRGWRLGGGGRTWAAGCDFRVLLRVALRDSRERFYHLVSLQGTGSRLSVCSLGHGGAVCASYGAGGPARHKSAVRRRRERAGPVVDPSISGVLSMALCDHVCLAGATLLALQV